MINGHGNDRYRYPGIKADFSSNAWYKGPDKELIGFLQKNLTCISNYPEPDAASLSGKLAGLHGLPAGNVIVTNGATEAFYLLAQFNSGKKSLVFYPSFSEYEDACRIFNCKLTFENINTIDSLKLSNQHEVVWLANPNSPDGKVTSFETIQKLCSRNQGTLFIVDEAYIDLSYSALSVVSLVEKYENLAVVRSLTKAFSVPGIRIGYIVASQGLINDMRKIKMPWSVSVPAILAGYFISENYQRLLPLKEDILEKSRYLQKETGSIPGFRVIASDSNFFLVKLARGTGKELKEFLISEHSILIRDASNFRGLDKSFVRISVQSDEDNRKLIEALGMWSEKKF